MLVKDVARRAGEGRVESVYARLKERVVNFQIRPGERMNEIALARDLDVSRTPLREALNRLVSERLIDFRPGRGFFCRELDPQSIFDLYEFRAIIEVAAVRRACMVGSDQAIGTLKAQLYEEDLAYHGKTVREVTHTDETFHLGIAALSGNAELVRQLGQVNERIRFIRWLDMASRVGTTKGEHIGIMEAIERRDADRAASVLQAHIERRMDDIVGAVKEGFSSIYVAGPEEIFDRQLEKADG